MKEIHYETLIVLAPNLTKAVLDKLVKSYIAMLEECQAQITYQGSLTPRVLAYPIRKYDNAIDQVIQFLSTPDVVGKMQHRYRYDENILRSFTIRLDKAATIYYQKKKEKEKALAENK